MNNVEQYVKKQMQLERMQMQKANKEQHKAIEEGVSPADFWLCHDIVLGKGSTLW